MDNIQNTDLNNNYTSGLTEITIIKDGIEFTVHPWKFKGYPPFESLSFNESINSTNMGGSLYIKDLFNWSEQLNAHSFDKLMIRFIEKTPSEDSSLKINELTFNIISVLQLTNRPMSTLMSDQQTYTIIRLDFTSDDIFASTLDSNMFPEGNDFVGFIATDDNSNISGLVNEIFKKLNIENYEIEPTFNGIWIKSNEISYPWGKNKGQIPLSNLMQYICNYSVSRLNPNAVNYFFWRDREGYKFKSVEKLLQDQQNREYEKINLSNNSNAVNQVRNITQMHEPNIFQLAKNSVFQTYYEKVVPNYDDYYLDFVDSSLSFKTEIVDFDYHRDHELWTKVEAHKIIPDSKNTSIYLENFSPIQSLKTDDKIYGYFNSNKLNTPFPQEWDHIGKTMDSRWNDISYIPQYDMTDLDIETFHTIHKKIREPLKEKRKKYAYLKNLKRKWEVYRCTVCCLSDRLGGIQDQIDIERLRGIENPNENPEFLALFGSTGIFSDSNVEYKIVAAGSFSDVYNYNAGVTANRGITLSYDLNAAPFNETIKDFYYFKDQFTEYEKYVLEGGLKTYDMKIEKNNQVLSMINEWLAVVDGYIQQANAYLDSKLEENECPEGEECERFSSNYNLYYGVTTEFLRNGNTCYGFSNLDPYGFDEASQTYFLLSDQPWVFECSLQKYLLDSIQSYKLVGCNPVTSFERINRSPYHYFYSNTEGLNFNPVDEKYKEIRDLIVEEIVNKKAYCPLCLNPVQMEIVKREAKKRKVIIEQNNILLLHMKERLQQQFVEKWKVAKEKYLNRKAFFISKKETKLEQNDQFIKSSNLSLMNVKSITRKAIRGSRYEILAKEKGLTGATIGSYLYNIFFDGITSDIGITGNHPYYDQTYGENAFLGLPKIKKVKELEDILPTNDPDLSPGWKYGPQQVYNDSKFPVIMEIDDNNSTANLKDLDYGNTILRKLNNYYGITGYENRFNLHQTNLKDKKPPNIKREEISSYVRVEFVNPIGIETIADFPQGFIRSAGTEYFLPYLVSLTAGPNGRQTIKNNIVVIGMDPYGFDVAMKRIQDAPQEGEYYWWSSNLGSGEMDLWPEVAFETKYTYYIQHEPNLNYFDSFIDLYGLSNNNYFAINSATIRPDPQFYTNSKLFDSVSNYGVSANRPNDVISSYGGNYKNNAKYDELLRETKNASKYLFQCNKVLKSHRSWWAFHVPENIIIMPSFDSIDRQYYYNFGDFGFESYSGNVSNIKFQTTYNYGYGLWGYNYWLGESRNSVIYDSNLYRKILKSKNTPDFQEIINKFDSADINFYFEEHHQHPTLYPYKSFETINPGLKTYFEDITNYWMQGDHIIYKPALVEQDVWKYDLSGYSEYGMNFPPVRHNHGDIFDNNFGAQFVVFAKTSDSICTKNNLKCINPNGNVYSNGCPENNPYCNCPAQNRKPTETEPSYLELYKLEQELKECSLIEEHLGPDWLGCVWSNPKNTGSCNCPEIGDRFMDYMAYNRTYATFWSTPPKTPLLRNTQFNLLFSQTLQVEIPRNDNIKIGDVVLVEDFDEITGEKYKRFGGKWLVTDIINIFYANKNYMSITLNRDSFHKDVNTGKLPEIE